MRLRLSRARIARVSGWLLAACLAGAGGALAQDEARRIIDVRTRGAKTVAEETILANVRTKPGMPYSDTVVSEDIRRLFALGYFADVRADVEELPEGLRLVFVVQEKPAIGGIEVDGNRVLKDPRVISLLGVNPGELFDPSKLKRGVDQVKAEYVRKGFAQAEVVAETREDPAANTISVFIAVDEGARLRIAEVLVEGNDAFPDSRVEKLIKSKRRWWFFPGIYNGQVLQEDLERVRAFYRKHGYQDAAVSHDVYRTPSGRGLIVHLTIEEGLQHRIGGVDVAGEVLFPEREIREVITLKPGAVYNTESLQEDLRMIKQYYGDRGYIHAVITPDTNLDPVTKRVDLVYRIEERELTYINRIDVEGNLKTRDVVVRRELRVFPGEVFDGAAIRKSIDRLYNLGYFEEVSVDTAPTDQANREDLVVSVREAKTGSFSFGGGFSSIDRLVGMVELEQRNFDIANYPTFTGAGQDLRLRVEVGTVRRYFDVSFTEPWIFGYPLSAGFDAYNRTRLRSRDLGLGYEEERRGGGLRLGKEFADTVRTGLGYQFYRTEISDVVEEASADLKAEQGKTDISLGSLSVAWDRRDNRFSPTDGFYVFASTDLAGGIFGADREFYRAETGASYYWPHGERFVLETRARAGIVDAYGDSEEVPIFERFFGGGAGTVRGYRERHVGPRDPFSNDPIGGEATFIGTIEEVMTVVEDERGRPVLQISVFVDTGDVWRRVADFGESLKSGLGVGARVSTPIGPVRLDMGYPLDDIAGEKKKIRFHFNISRSF
ncbi:MAG TPA: outer membrane protein assembly factor BamA [bacterium]